jgi:hypothetical protein
LVEAGSGDVPAEGCRPAEARVDVALVDAASGRRPDECVSDASALSERALSLAAASFEAWVEHPAPRSAEPAPKRTRRLAGSFMEQV